MAHLVTVVPGDGIGRVSRAARLVLDATDVGIGNGSSARPEFLRSAGVRSADAAGDPGRHPRVRVALKGPITRPWARGSTG